MFIYESHLGGLYATDDMVDDELLYCEQCGDSDWLIGVANTKQEAWAILKCDTDINGSGGWNFNYIKEFLDANWDE